MNPLRIRAENLGPYETLDLAIPSGTVAILGELLNAPEGISSNGAGKSTLLAAIPLALFGPPKGIRTLAPFLTEDSGATTVTVEVEFEHGGEVYRVRRAFNSRGAGKSTLDFERCNEVRVDHNGSAHRDAAIPTTEAWSPLTAESAKETQAAIDRTLGLTRETFLASSLALQDDGSFADPSIDPAARKKLLADALGLDRWEQYAARAKADRKLLDVEKAGLDARVADAAELLAAKPGVEKDAAAFQALVATSEERLADAHATLDALLARHTEAMAQTAAVDTARATLAAAEAEHRRLAQVTTDAEAARAQVAPLEAEARTLDPLLEELPVREAEATRIRGQVEAHARLVAEHQAAELHAQAVIARRTSLEARAEALVGEAHVLEQRAVHALEHLGDPCDRCKRPLGAEDAQRAAESYRVEASAITKQAATLRADADAIESPEVGEPPAGEPPTKLLSDVEASVQRGRDAAVRLAALRERIRGLQQKIREAEDTDYANALAESEIRDAHAKLALTKLEKEAPSSTEVEQIKRDGLAARAHVNTLQQQLDTARADHTRATTRLEHIAAVEESTASARARLAALVEEREQLLALERAYGRDGIPALILENTAVPYIETEATRILTELGTSFRIELRTQEATKDGASVRDVLNVIVLADGVERPYLLCSGGEKTRVGIALRIALASLLANRRGAESRLLAIDEPRHLDRAGMERLVEVLRALEGTFDRIILVSHIAEIRDAVDQTIVVVKDGNRSRVLTPDRETVAA